MFLLFSKIKEKISKSELQGQSQQCNQYIVEHLRHAGSVQCFTLIVTASFLGGAELDFGTATPNANTKVTPKKEKYVSCALCALLKKWW